MPVCCWQGLITVLLACSFYSQALCVLNGSRATAMGVLVNMLMHMQMLSSVLNFVLTWICVRALSWLFLWKRTVYSRDIRAALCGFSVTVCSFRSGGLKTFRQACFAARTSSARSSFDTLSSGSEKNPTVFLFLFFSCLSQQLHKSETRAFYSCNKEVVYLFFFLYLF